MTRPFGYKLICLILCAVFLFGMAGCSSNANSGDTGDSSAVILALLDERTQLQNELSTVQGENIVLKTNSENMQKENDSLRAENDSVKKENSELKNSLTQAEAEVNALKNQPTPPPAATDHEQYAVGVGCTINGTSRVLLSGQTELTCVATEPQNYVFDHWEVDGTISDIKTKTAKFTASKSTTIQAVFHQRHILKGINCHFQFLTKNGNASGTKMTEFDFEESYKNTVTKATCEGGKISFYITADIPKNSSVDYWLINGVKYEFAKDVTKFKVEDLDEATTYEVVLKGQKKTTQRDPSPTVYYTVTCHNCSFSGGGKSGTSGKVPAGTKITVSATSTSSQGYFTGSPSGVNKGLVSSNGYSQGSNGSFYYKFSFTYTVNADTDVTFNPVIN